MNLIEKYQQPPQPSNVRVGKRGSQINPLSMREKFVSQVQVTSVVDCPLVFGIPLEPLEIALLRDVSGTHELRYVFSCVRELAPFERRP